MRNCEPKYKIWIDEWDHLHATIHKAIEDGLLPPVDFDPSTLRTSFDACSLK